MAKLLVADDERSMRELLELVFKREGHQVTTVSNGREALEALQKNTYELLITDVKMPDLGGIELLKAAREQAPEMMVIMMTAFATINSAREAFKLGADDFIQKPFDVDEFKLVVRKAIEKLDLRQENALLKRELLKRGNLGDIIGRSPQMQAVYRMVETVAANASTVLIIGESGTGKELVARAVHSHSPRRDRPFVSVNCGAFTETLLTETNGRSFPSTAEPSPKRCWNLSFLVTSKARSRVRNPIAKVCLKRLKAARFFSMKSAK